MNDDQEKTEDLAINDDGSIATDSSTNIEVKVEAPAEPEINEAVAPAEPVIVEVDSTNEAVNSETETESVVSEQPIFDEEPELTSVQSAPAESAPAESEVAAPLTPVGVDKPQSSTTPSSAQPPAEHRNNKKLAVILTVLVALLLAGAAVYVYISAEDNTAETVSDSQTTKQDMASQESIVEPATPTDVDQTVAEIDQTLDEIDTETSVNTNEETISDENLGLN
jgi:hypothetical protein